MDSKKVPALLLFLIACIAFSNEQITIGICFLLLSAMAMPGWLAAASRLFNYQVTGKIKALIVLALLSVIGIRIFLNARQHESMTAEKKQHVEAGNKLLAQAHEAILQRKATNALHLARQASDELASADSLGGTDSLHVAAATFATHTSTAINQLAKAKQLSDFQFANLKDEDHHFVLDVRRYFDTELREQEAKRPGLKKIYANRKEAARKQGIANEKRRRAEAAAQEREERQEKIDARRAYASRAREVFLDNAMDIKVTVTGKNADVLNLSYPLFSDVWTHKMEKEGMREQWKELGFRRVNVKDNYDYSVYYDLK